jgi:hypothetical protein
MFRLTASHINGTYTYLTSLFLSSHFFRVFTVLGGEFIIARPFDLQVEPLIGRSSRSQK